MNIKKDIYLKKLGSRGKINIFIVDGIKVRSEIDEEFTNCGQHFRFPFIPKYEFWLDKEAVPDERRFFIDHLLTEWKLMDAGHTYEYAIDEADKVELSERQKTKEFKELEKKDYDQIIKKIHVKLLKKMDNGIFVWLVDGKLVRDLFFIDFTAGGHEYVYKFVPKKEVWLDNDILAKERDFVLLHELFEREKMSKGMTYNRAHRRASKLEWECRQEEEKLKESLGEQGYT